MSDPGKAVFLSYASQDAEAARRICEALRAAGVEVWFDQNELVGGDTWDAKIRGQIGSCALFLPIISANSQARLEGYFRREWKQAAARTHDMADEKTFLLPVVIDDTRDADAKVPAEFKAVQWTRLPGGESTRTFCDRVRQLVSGEAGGARADRSPDQPSASGRVHAPGMARWAKAGSVLAVAGVALAGWLFLRGDRKETVPAVPPSAAATAPISEARGLALRAAALLQDPMMVKESVLAAEELCARAVALDPQDGEAWAVYALVAAELIGAYGDKTTLQIENARSRAERAIRLAPDSVNAALALAHFEVFVDRSAKGTEDRLRSLWARAPEEKRIAKLLSLALIGQGRVDESDAILDEAARRPGGNYLALARRGWSLFHTGRWGTAEATFDASLALQPNREAYHGKLIFLHAALGDLDRTRALLESLPPGQLREDRVAYVGYRTWMGLREPDRAIEAVRRINRDFINEGQIELPVRFGVGEAHQLAGRPQAAATEWAAALVSVEQRLKAEPADADLVRWRTLLQARLGRLEEAERSFGLWRELRGIRPEETSRLDAQVLLALGRPDEAVAVLSSRMSPAADQARFAAMYYLTLRNNPAFDPLRGRSDFVAAMKQGEALWRDFLVKAGLPAPAGKDDPARATGAAGDKSVAVLAFANLSDDKANEYFSDGISEELLNVLAKVPGLKVTARTSAFHFKGKDLPIPEIARQLGVAYVVEGSVRKQGERVRITAQLIKAADGFHVWSDTFTRDLKDIFAVQDEIAGLIARNLQLTLGAGRPTARPVDPEAHRLVLEGRHYLALRGEANFARADEAFRGAVAIAPDLAIAHAGLAELVAQRGRYQQLAGLTAPGSQVKEVQGHVERALQLDPTLSEPHAALSAALFDGGRFDEAEAAAARGLALNPNYGSLHLWTAHVQVARGRLDLGLTGLQRATELDPLAFVGLYIRAAYVAHAGRYTEGLMLAERAASLRGEPFPPLEGERAIARAFLGRHEEATGLARKILALPDLVTLGWWSVGEALWVLRQGGAEAEAARHGEAFLAQLAPDNYLRGYVLCGLGRFEEGLPLLHRLPTLARIRLYYHPLFDPVRETPAFRKLIQDLNVSPAYSVARETLARMIQESRK